jgi:hypothetical protein
MEHLIPPAVAQIFADPPLVRGEEAGAYQAMVAQLGAESGAASIVDWLLVKDVADLTWQIARTRRWVSAFVDGGERSGLAAAIQPFVADRTRYCADFARRLVAEHCAKGEGGRTALLAQYGLSARIGGAQAFFTSLRRLAEAEDLLMRLEYRRDRALAQIEVRRATFGKALRAATNGVIDAETVAHEVAVSPALAPPLPATAAEAVVEMPVNGA